MYKYTTLFCGIEVIPRENEDNETSFRSMGWIIDGFLTTMFFDYICRSI